MVYGVSSVHFWAGYQSLDLQYLLSVHAIRGQRSSLKSEVNAVADISCFFPPFPGTGVWSGVV